MRYGVNQKVDIQLVVGDGICRIFRHLRHRQLHRPRLCQRRARSHAEKLVLIRKIMADLYAAGYPADAIVLNPADWATIEIELFTTAAGQTLYSGQRSRSGRLFGIPVIQVGHGR